MMRRKFCDYNGYNEKGYLMVQLLLRDRDFSDQTLFGQRKQKAFKFAKVSKQKTPFMA
jgi:hypothetical protein